MASYNIAGETLILVEGHQDYDIDTVNNNLKIIADAINKLNSLVSEESIAQKVEERIEDLSGFDLDKLNDIIDTLNRDTASDTLNSINEYVEEHKGIDHSSLTNLEENLEILSDLKNTSDEQSETIDNIINSQIGNIEDLDEVLDRRLLVDSINQILGYIGSMDKLESGLFEVQPPIDWGDGESATPIITSPKNLVNSINRVNKYAKSLKEDIDALDSNYAETYDSILDRIRNVLLSKKSDALLYESGEPSSTSFYHDITLSNIRILYYGRCIDINDTISVQTDTASSSKTIYIGMVKGDYDETTGEYSASPLVTRLTTNPDSDTIYLPQPLVVVNYEPVTSGTTKITSVEWVSDNELCSLENPDYTDYITAIYNMIKNDSTNEIMELVERIKYYGDPDIVPTDTMYFTFTVNDDGKTATIEMSFDVDFDVTDLVIPYKCTINDKKYIVTNIADSAFYTCTTLESVIIPSTITNIDTGAFYGCTLLSSVTIPDSVNTIGISAFYGCKALTSVIVPGSMTTIDSSTFQNCTSLASVTIPNGITTINYGAFQKCSSLTSVVIPSSVTTIKASVFASCTSLASIVIPSSVESIGNYTFDGCTNLSVVCEQGSVADNYTKENDINVKYDIINSSSINSIGDLSTLTTTANDTLVNAINEVDLADERIKYYGDPHIVPTDDSYFVFTANDDGTTATIESTLNEIYDIVDLVIPYKCTIDGKEYVVTTIPRYGFDNRKSLTSTSLRSVVIPNSITVIPDGAFYDWPSLESVVIPDTVTSIGYMAFSGCTSLKSITIPDNVTIIGNSAFKNCASIESITMSNNVTSIESSAFSGCTSLKSITLSNSITAISDSTFSNCESLLSIVIPDSVSTIGRFPFSDCTSLTSVAIPNSVTSIDVCAFIGCESLKIVTIPNSVTTINDLAFEYCSSDLTILCGQNSVAEEYAKLNSINYKYDVVDSDTINSIGDLSTLTTSINDTLVNAVNEVDLADERIKYYGDPDIVPTDARYFTFIANSDGKTATIKRNSDVDFDVTDLVIPYKCTIKDKEYIVNTIGSFINCSTLKTVIMPNSITTINMTAFTNCSALTSVIISNNVTSIGYFAFQNCSTLASVVIPDSVVTISDYAFDSTLLTSVVIPHSVTTIEKFVFQNCSKLTSIVIPNSVTAIGNYTFDGCTNLTITCEQGSYAETYAKNNSINYKYDILDSNSYNSLVESIDILAGICTDYTIEPVFETLTDKFTITRLLYGYKYCVYAGDTAMTDTPVDITESTVSATGAFEGDNITVKIYDKDGNELYTAKLDTYTIGTKKIGKFQRIEV